jgi:nucleotide-binding universal stress UspA family protein
LTRTLQSKLKRQRARRQTAFLVFGCTAVIGLVLLVFTLTSPRYADDSRSSRNDVQTAGEVVQPQETQSQPVASTGMLPLSLGVGGDVSFGLAMADIVAAEGAAYPWTEVSALLDIYDISVANLEGPLCRGTSPNPAQSTVCMKGDTSCAAPMADAGIDVVCLSNDHIMDYGAAGLEETLNILRAEELAAFGAGSSKSAAEQPLVLNTENGATIALLSFCDVAPPAYTAGVDTPGISQASLEDIGEAVATAAQGAQYVAVFVHWGEVGSPEITTRQREIARACVEAGADLVVGCHPHVVQGIELLDGVPVIYSLGNLVFSSDSEMGKTAIFAGCGFSGGRLTSLEIIPLRVEGAHPVPLYGEQAENVLRSLQEASPGVRLEVSSATGTATVGL